MSCKYCDLKRRKDEDDDAEWIAGEDWESESDDGGYICPHGDGFRMLVYYDARCACTVVDNIKYCPFCGEELKAPKEPLIKDEKIRKAIKYIFPECGLIRIEKQGGSRIFRFGGTRLEIYAPDENAITHGCTYLVAELCGEEDE